MRSGRAQGEAACDNSKRPTWFRYYPRPAIIRQGHYVPAIINPHGHALPPGCHMSRHLIAGFALLFPLTLSAQDKAPSGDKQKEFAAEAMKKAEVKDARVVETTHLVLATTLPDAKAKAIAEAIEKAFVS